MNRGLRVFDIHCDILGALKNPRDFFKENSSHHTSFSYLKRGGVAVQVWSLYVSPSIPFWRRRLRRQLRTFARIKALSSCSVHSVLNGKELLSNDDDIAVILELEGLHSAKGDLSYIKWLFDAGARIFTLTWNNPNEFAGSCVSGGGLTSLGRDAVKLIESLDGIIDLSHSSDDTARDVLKIVSKPPILSHSCARAIVNVERNAPDWLLREIGNSGGIVGLNLYSGFLVEGENAAVRADALARHIEHIASMAGDGAVALGSDADGIPNFPMGLEGVADFPKIDSKLMHRFGRDFLDGFWYANAKRYLVANLP